MILRKLVYVSAFIWFNKCVFADNMRCEQVRNQLFGGSSPDYNCEFICSENNSEHNIFTFGDRITVENDGVTRGAAKTDILSIDLKGCRFLEIGTKLFE